MRREGNTGLIKIFRHINNIKKCKETLNINNRSSLSSWFRKYGRLICIYIKQHLQRRGAFWVLTGMRTMSVPERRSYTRFLVKTQDTQVRLISIPGKQASSWGQFRLGYRLLLIWCAEAWLWSTVYLDQLHSITLTCHLWELMSVIQYSSFYGCRMAEWEQHPSSSWLSLLGIYIYINTLLCMFFIYVWPHVMFLQSWIYFSSGNILTASFPFLQDSTAVTITFPPEFTQLPRYQDWKRDKHTIKICFEMSRIMCTVLSAFVSHTSTRLCITTKTTKLVVRFL